MTHPVSLATPNRVKHRRLQGRPRSGIGTETVAERRSRQSRRMSCAGEIPAAQRGVSRTCTRQRGQFLPTLSATARRKRAMPISIATLTVSTCVRWNEPTRCGSRGRSSSARWPRARWSVADDRPRAPVGGGEHGGLGSADEPAPLGTYALSQAPGAGPAERAQDARLDDRPPAAHARSAPLGRRLSRSTRGCRAEPRLLWREPRIAPARMQVTPFRHPGTCSSPPEWPRRCLTPAGSLRAAEMASSSHAPPPPPPARPHGRAGWPAAEA